MTEERKNCPMRDPDNGNCWPCGGFCIDAVSDEICSAMRNAYDYGFTDGALHARLEWEKKVQILRGQIHELQKKNPEKASEKCLSIEELDKFRKENRPVWVVTTGYVHNKSGWALAGTRQSITQDFWKEPLWYSTYLVDWIAYERPPLASAVPEDGSANQGEKKT